jgi:hypothetical protein
MSETERKLEGGGIEKIPDADTKAEWERIKKLRKKAEAVSHPRDLTADDMKELIWAVAKHLKIIP